MKQDKTKKDIKMGARILGLEELSKLLPNYQNVIDQIGEIRDVAKKYNKATEKKQEGSYNLRKEMEFNKHFDNIFSILGERGSGKTSVMLTLKYMLTEGYEVDKTVTPPNTTDMFMPVVVPEDMESSSDILGWLIGYLNDIVQEIDKEIDVNANSLYNDRQCYEYFERCSKKRDNPLSERYKDLQEAYQIRTADYKSILKENYVGTNEYIEDRSRVTEFDQKLIGRFQGFWQELMNIKRKINKGVEPLLFIFFDDVDICTERCYEILNTTMRYLAYPNIIIFISGNYKTFSEVLTIDFLKRDGLLGDQMDRNYWSPKKAIEEIDTALEVRKKLAQDYLLKVMPPALRYYMPYYTDKMKAGFRYTDIKSYSKEGETGNDSEIDSKYETLYELLVKNFINSSGNEDDERNFLKYKYKNSEENGQGTSGEEKGGKEDEILYPFFKIFPDNSRGLLNIYYFLYSKLNITDIKKKWNSNNLNQFLEIIINSSGLFGEYRDEIYKIIEIGNEYDEMEKMVYIDYTYLLSAFENYKLKEQYKNNINSLTDDFISIFMLAYFFENILGLIHYGERDATGYTVLIEILNSIKSDFIVYPRSEDISLLLRIYELMPKQSSNKVPISNRKENLIYELMPRQNANEVLISNRKERFLIKYFEIIEEYAKKDSGDLRNFFEKFYKKDELWTDEKLDMIMDIGGRQNRALKLEKENTFELLKEINHDEDFLKEAKGKIEEEKKRRKDWNLKIDILEELDDELNVKREAILKPYDSVKFDEIDSLIKTLYTQLNNVINSDLNDNSKLNSAIDNIDGFIKKLEDICKGHQNIDTEYWKKFKENIPQLENLKKSIIEVINELIKSNELHKKDEDANKECQNKVSKSIEPMMGICEQLIKESNMIMLYKNLEARLKGEIDFKGEIDNLKEIKNQRDALTEDARKKNTIVTIEEYMEIENRIGNRFTIKRELEKVIEVYEKTFNELRQATGTMDIVIKTSNEHEKSKSAEFENYLNDIISSGTQEIGNIAKTIKNKLEEDGLISRTDLYDHLDLIDKHLEIEQNKNPEAGKKEKYEKISIRVKLIRYLPVTYKADIRSREFYYELAKAKLLDHVLLNYIRVKALLEIDKRNESKIHKHFRLLKHELIDYIGQKNTEAKTYFDIYLEHKEENSIKVDLGN